MMMSSTTSCVLASNLMLPFAATGAGCWGGAVAGCCAETAITHARNVATIGRMLEPQPHRRGERAHRARSLQQAVLRGAHGRVPRVEVHMIQRVSGVHPEVN